jgi:hypothetical protein
MIICKDEAVQISGRNKYDTMFWCMVLLYARRENHKNAVEYQVLVTEKFLTSKKNEPLPSFPVKCIDTLSSSE